MALPKGAVPPAQAVNIGRILDGGTYTGNWYAVSRHDFASLIEEPRQAVYGYHHLAKLAEQVVKPKPDQEKPVALYMMLQALTDLLAQPAKSPRPLCAGWLAGFHRRCTSSRSLQTFSSSMLRPWVSNSGRRPVWRQRRASAAVRR
jgi:hypothetical protein